MDDALRQNLKKAAQAIREAESVAVYSHMNPDGDSIGSVLALGLSLIHTNKKIFLLCEDPVPRHLQFLPASELVSARAPRRVDVAVALDCGSPKQLGKLQKDFFEAGVTVQVDHHDTGQGFGQIRVIEKDASAVGEVVYELLIQMKAVVTREIASCLLTSIIIDTGFFRFANIRPKTFDICSRLIKTGVELRELVEEAYWKKSVPTARLMGYCFSKVRLYDDGSIACADVSQRTLKRFKAKLSDLDNVADELRSIEGVRVAVLMRQTEKRSVRASLRSIGSLNVAGVAKQFGGGGHHNSAGCRLSDTPREKARFLAAVRELLRA